MIILNTCRSLKWILNWKNWYHTNLLLYGFAPQSMNSLCNFLGKWIISLQNLLKSPKGKFFRNIAPFSKLNFILVSYPGGQYKCWFSFKIRQSSHIVGTNEKQSLRITWVSLKKLKLKYTSWNSRPRFEYLLSCYRLAILSPKRETLFIGNSKLFQDLSYQLWTADISEIGFAERQEKL